MSWYSPAAGSGSVSSTGSNSTVTLTGNYWPVADVILQRPNGLVVYSGGGSTAVARGTALIAAGVLSRPGDITILGPGTFDLGTAGLVMAGSLVGQGNDSTYISGINQSTNVSVSITGVGGYDIRDVYIVSTGAALNLGAGNAGDIVNIRDSFIGQLPLSSVNSVLTVGSNLTVKHYSNIVSGAMGGLKHELHDSWVTASGLAINTTAGANVDSYNTRWTQYGLNSAVGGTSASFLYNLYGGIVESLAGNYAARMGGAGATLNAWGTYFTAPNGTGVACGSATAKVNLYNCFVSGTLTSLLRTNGTFAVANTVFNQPTAGFISFVNTDSQLAAIQSGALSRSALGIGIAFPTPGAILDINSSTSGLLLPRATSGNITTPSAGMIIYDTGVYTNTPAVYNGSAWTPLYGRGLSIGDYYVPDAVHIPYNSGAVPTTPTVLYTVPNGFKAILMNAYIYSTGINAGVKYTLNRGGINYSGAFTSPAVPNTNRYVLNGGDVLSYSGVDFQNSALPINVNVSFDIVRFPSGVPINSTVVNFTGNAYKTLYTCPTGYNARPYIETVEFPGSYNPPSLLIYNNSNTTMGTGEIHYVPSGGNPSAATIIAITSSIASGASAPAIVGGLLTPGMTIQYRQPATASGTIFTTVVEIPA